MIENNQKPNVLVSLASMLLLRLAIMAGFLIFLPFIGTADRIAFYSLMAFAFIITIPYWLWLRNQPQARHITPMLLIVDVVFVTAMVYFTGGLNSGMTLLYPLIILSGGVVTTPRQAIQITVFSIVIYVVLIALMFQNVIASYKVEPLVSRPDLMTVLISTTLQVFLFVFFGIVSVYLARRFQFIHRKNREYRDIFNKLFNAVRSGLLLIDAKGVILMANTCAKELLACEKDALVGKAINSLLVKETGSGSRTAAPAHLRTGSGRLLPITFHQEQVSLPDEMVPGGGEDDRWVQTTVMVFDDITEILSLQESLHRDEKLKTAARLAAKIAHEIRTPLTAIVSAHELIRQMEQKAARQAPRVSSDKTELFEQIARESERIDKTIQHYLDSMEYSMEDLVRILELDSAMRTEQQGG